MTRIRLYTSARPKGRRKGRIKRKKNPEATTTEQLGRPSVPRVATLMPVRLHVERLPEGVYLATSVDIPGLVAQGGTLAETLEIARDVARRLLEARHERSEELLLPTSAEPSDYTIVVEM